MADFTTPEFIYDNSEVKANKKYWLYEEPEIRETGKNAIRYYPEAGKIQFALCDYIEARKDAWGVMREMKKPGKSAALDLVSLSEEQETLQWLIEILQSYLIE